MTYEDTEPVTVSADALRASFKALESQIDAVRVVPDEKGWHIYGLALDHSSMVNVDINREAFTEYEVWDPFALRISVMLEALGKAGKDMTLSISGGLLVMAIGRFIFRRGLEADFEEYPKVPSKELPIEVAMQSDILKDMACSVSEKEAKSRGLTFRQTEDRLDAESREYGDPVNTTVVSVAKADALIMGGEGESTYSQERLRNIAGTIPKGVDVDMLYGPRDLLRLSYTVEHADVTFVLAPWIEDAE